MDRKSLKAIKTISGREVTKRGPSGGRREPLEGPGGMKSRPPKTAISYIFRPSSRWSKRSAQITNIELLKGNLSFSKFGAALNAYTWKVEINWSTLRAFPIKCERAPILLGALQFVGLSAVLLPDGNLKLSRREGLYNWPFHWDISRPHIFAPLFIYHLYTTLPLCRSSLGSATPS